MLVFFRGVTPKIEGTRGEIPWCPMPEALIIGQGILTWAAKETDDGAGKRRVWGDMGRLKQWRKRATWQGQSKIVSRYHDIRSIYNYDDICFIYILILKMLWYFFLMDLFCSSKLWSVKFDLMIFCRLFQTPTFLVGQKWHQLLGSNWQLPWQVRFDDWWYELMLFSWLKWFN